MKSLACILVASFAAGLILESSAAGAAEPIWPPETTPRQINVTSDSERGWLPSQEQVAQLRKTMDAFLAAKDGGRADEAYALLADINRQGQPFAGFKEQILKFNQQAGPLKQRRIVTVTWTKDPAQAPAQGVYAALDMISWFANIDRHCGFLILYQAPSGGAFQVMREEDNFMDNATAKTIESQHSRADVDKAWARLSDHCPNYPAEPPAPLPEQPDSSVGYPTVAAALLGLHSKPEVKFSSQAGWTVAIDPSTYTVWSFPPPGDPAYPAVVKRQIVQNGPESDMSMTVHCESTKQACDNLVRQFGQLNAKATGTTSPK